MSPQNPLAVYICEHPVILEQLFPEMVPLSPFLQPFLLKFSVHCLNWGREGQWRGGGKNERGDRNPNQEALLVKFPSLS